MITREEYLKALDIVEKYHKQLDIQNVSQVREKLSPELQKNDFVEYVGGSKSAYLTKGRKYRLTGTPFRNRICVINDKGKWMNTKQCYFKMPYLCRIQK
ncbi:hypothetical protein ACT3CE_18195 [Marinifilum sp. RC60d5]|uniref:hypothetical protein n=1 Tax=Marinifilum sp. RC60d5 TaxID=3458414 RepID=UPI0040360FA1